MRALLSKWFGPEASTARTTVGAVVLVAILLVAYQLIDPALAKALGMLIGAIIIYFVPSIVARSRRVPNLGPIFVINLFLGWTLIGWVVALAMAVRDVPQENP